MARKKAYKKSDEGGKVKPSIAKKKARVEEISSKLKGAKTVALLDVRNLPDKILQKSRKQLRGKADFMMAKNTVLKRSLSTSGAKQLEQLVDSPSVVVASKDMSAYSIYKHFRDNKMKVAAKPGQVAEEDIVVPAGETDLPPGPALSELKAAKINAMIKAGKIAVQKDSLVAKKGEKIEAAVSKALQKLGILPFTAGVNMVAGVEDSMLYSAEVLDVDEVILTQDLKSALGDAYNMSVNCSYPTEMNAKAILAQAYAQSRGLVETAGAYSTAHMELLLAPAIRMEEFLQGKVGNIGAGTEAGAKPEEKSGDAKEAAGEAKTSEAKPEEKSEGPEAEKPKAEEKSAEGKKE